VLTFFVGAVFFAVTGFLLFAFTALVFDFDGFALTFALAFGDTLLFIFDFVAIVVLP
jgi:hypothetical protein